MIPRPFEQWIDCIIQHCGTNLTKDFAGKHLAIYQERHNKETQRFIALYGERHFENIINRLKQV